MFTLLFTNLVFFTVILSKNSIKNLDNLILNKLFSTLKFSN